MAMRSYFAIFVLIVCVCSAQQRGSLQIITEFKPGVCSETAATGDTVAVHYTGRLANGQIFDSSVEAKRDPIKFTLGMGKVIPGWEKGIMGMCIGEKRKLIIPPELAYGANGVKGVIPPQATLTFQTELVELEKDQTTIDKTIQNFLMIAIWPALVILVLFTLYKRVTAADEKMKAEKFEKKGRKKKH